MTAEFREQGYLVIPGAIPGIMIDEALRVINHSLGEEGMNKDDLPTLRARPAISLDRHLARMARGARGR